MTRMIERLQRELADAGADLSAHLASWEYAFAMGSTCHGGRDHPTLHDARQEATRLKVRCGDLRARIAEFE